MRVHFKGGYWDPKNPGDVHTMDSLLAGISVNDNKARTKIVHLIQEQADDLGAAAYFHHMAGDSEYVRGIIDEALGDF